MFTFSLLPQFWKEKETRHFVFSFLLELKQQQKSKQLNSVFWFLVNIRLLSTVLTSKSKHQRVCHVPLRWLKVRILNWPIPHNTLCTSNRNRPEFNYSSRKWLKWAKSDTFGLSKHKIFLLSIQSKKARNLLRRLWMVPKVCLARLNAMAIFTRKRIAVWANKTHFHTLKYFELCIVK